MKASNPLIKRIAGAVLGALLLFYVAYQAYIINYVDLKTETATYAELSDTIQTDAWFIRNERVITSNHNGVLSYVIDNGQKVANGGVVAYIYSNEDDATAEARIERLNTEIASLEALATVGDYYSGKSDLVGAQISNSIIGILTAAKNNEYDSIESLRSSLQYSMSEKQIILGNEAPDDYSARIDQLKQERAQIQFSVPKAIGKIHAPNSGYYISTVDGYEESFDFDNVLNLRVEDLQNVEEPMVTERTAGKICRDFNWYVAFVCDEKNMLKLQKSGETYVQIPGVSDKIPAVVEALNADRENGMYSAILRCNYMNSDVASIRNTEVEIIVDSYSGVLVNEKAIRFETITVNERNEDGNERPVVYENVRGVYIKSGGKIRFVQIFTDTTINGYAICKTNLSDVEKEELVTYSTIKLYDEVVIGGTDLYDGKLL